MGSYSMGSGILVSNKQLLPFTDDFGDIKRKGNYASTKNQNFLIKDNGMWPVLLEINIHYIELSCLLYNYKL